MGWQPTAFSEIEPFPSAVLAHHYPQTPNWGDMTRFKEWPDANIDVLVGGTPCQSFSVAGLRKGLDDPRGNLMLTYLAIADRYRPQWVVWENVPGVLSSNNGRDFGAFLGGLGQLGYGFAYRVLDAQYFGLAQRRRRVFVVGCLGGWQRAAAVLFEQHSLSGDIAPSREAREATARGADGGAGASGAALTAWPAEIACTLNEAFGSKQGLEDQHALSGAPLFVPDTLGTMTARMFNGLGARDVEEGALLPIAFEANMSMQNARTDGVNQTLTRRTHAAVAIQDVRAVNKAQNGKGWNDKDVAYTVDTHATQGVAVAFDTTQLTSPSNYSNPQPGGPCHPLAAGAHPPAVIHRYIGGVDYENNAHTMNEPTGPLLKGSPSGGGRPLPAVVFEPGSIARNAGPAGESSLAPTLRSNMGDNQPAVRIAMQVRRLTPTECERLQGFPDNYTNIPWRKKLESPDGPRYKALGNSMAVPVMRWIGERIQAVEAI
jgi:DNA (cytosine-5)-methyltransferase 1